MAIRIKINGNDLEGSADDIALLISKLGVGGVDPEQREQVDNPEIESRKGEITKEFAARALSRRQLSPAQRKLFRMLARAGADWLPSSQIMERMDLNGNAFGGLFGAIGRRVAMTNGFKEGYTLFQWHWDEDREENDCRLHPAALAAVMELNP